jgi:hypothetical protein
MSAAEEKTITYPEGYEVPKVWEAEEQGGKFGACTAIVSSLAQHLFDTLRLRSSSMLTLLLSSHRLVLQAR